MPGKRKLRVATAPAAAPKTKAKPQPADIDRARRDAMALIAQQRAVGDADNVFLEKAHRLLTRHWARSGWAARGTLVKTADWLIRVAAANPSPPPAPQPPERKRR